MVSMYNSEGYKDPVVYEVLTRVEAEERAARVAAAYRPLVYIYAFRMLGKLRRISTGQEPFPDSRKRDAFSEIELYDDEDDDFWDEDLDDEN